MANSHQNPSDNLRIANHIVVLEVQRHRVQTPSANWLGKVGALRDQHTDDVVAQSLATASIHRTLDRTQAEHASTHLVVVRVGGQSLLNACDDCVHKVDIHDNAQLRQRLGSYATVYSLHAAQRGQQNIPSGIQPGMGLQVEIETDGKLRLSSREHSYICDAPEDAANVVSRVLTLFLRQFVCYE